MTYLVATSGDPAERIHYQRIISHACEERVNVPAIPGFVVRVFKRANLILVIQCAPRV
jgi:hypothetical protein